MAADGAQHRVHHDHGRYHRHDYHMLRRVEASAFSWLETRIAAGSDEGGGGLGAPRSYPCSFCQRQFRSAQALGGHMNVHRRDRARLCHGSPPDATSYCAPRSSSGNNSTAAQHHEYHPPTTITIFPDPPPDPAPLLMSGASHTSNYRTPHRDPDQLSSPSKVLSGTGSATSLPTPSPLFNPVPPKQHRSHDYAGGPPSTAAHCDGSARCPPTCLQLKSSSAAAAVDNVLQATPQISLNDDRPDAAESSQPPSAIASCGLHNSISLLLQMKREISRKSASTWRPCSTSSSGSQPCFLHPRSRCMYTVADRQYQNSIESVNAVDETLIISPAAGLDLELRLGQN